MFLAVILSLFVLGDLLWGWYVVGKLREPGVKGTRLARWGLAVTIAFFLVTAGGLGLALATRMAGAPHVLPVPVMIAVYVWHLLVLPGFLIFATLGTAVAGAVRAARKLIGTARPLVEPDPGRRRFLAGAASLAPATVVATTTGLAIRGLSDFDVRTMDVPVPGLPPDLDGLTIAHLADTHLGDFSPAKLYRKMIDATNALRADLIVHTGDVINVDADDIPLAMEGLRKLDAPLGIFACEGNHDLIQSPGKFWAAMRALPNVKFLRNEATTVKIRGVPVQFLGARWGTHSASAGNEFQSACDDLAGAVEKDAFPILLGHHPHVFDYAPWAKLTLSGHTHGGQVMLTKRLGPGPLMYRYWSGLYRQSDPAGGRTLVVSNGAGNWFPIRTPAAAAEIVKLTLRRA